MHQTDYGQEEYVTTAFRRTFDSTYDLTEDLNSRFNGYWDCKKHGKVDDAYRDNKAETL